MAWLHPSNPAVASKRRLIARPLSGFSLVEVVLAVGVAAVAVVGVVALYRPVLRGVADVREAASVEPVIRQMESYWREQTFADLVSATSAGTPVYATRDAGVVGTAAAAAWNAFGTTPAERDAAKYFKGVLLRNETLSPMGEVNPGSLVVTLHLRWPAYRADGAQVTDPTLQSTRLIPLAFSR